MTTDSLKSFITLPTMTIYKKSGSNSNAKLLCFSILLAVFCVTISCFQIWNVIRANNLQTEIDTLRDKLDEMRKRVELDLLDGLDEFEKVHDPANGDGDDDFTYENDDDGDEIDNELGDFDEDDDDLLGDEDSLELLHDLSHRSDGINDANRRQEKRLDDEEDDLSDGSGILKFGFDDDDYDNERIYDEIRKSRKPRSVPPHEGVPIIEESYAVRRNKSHTPMDDYIKDILINKKPDNPKLKYDWASKTGRGNGEVPRQHLERFAEHRAPPTEFVTPPGARQQQQPAQNVHIRHGHHREQQLQRRHHTRTHKSSYAENKHKYQEWATVNHIPRSTVEPEPIYTRESRVMLTNEDKSQAFRQVITKKEYARLKATQNAKQFVESVAHPEMVVYPAKKQPMRMTMKSSDGKVIRQVQSRPRVIAVHYSGDTSRYVSGRHEHYHGNGLLRHSGGIYTDWVAPHWVNHLGMDRFFALDQGGIVTVKETGLYYIYAQIFYKDDHDTNGYVIEQNSEPILQCSTMTHSSQRLSKTNTCYTGGIHFLRMGDTVKVVDLGNHRLSIFELGKSFFGLIKMSGEIRAPHPRGNPPSEFSTPPANY